MNIAILGTGASAAFIYQAVKRAPTVGEIHIYSDQGMQIPTGAFYLHKLPPNTSGESLYKMDVLYTSIGTVEGYMEKQWGNSFVSSEYINSCSFPKQDIVKQGYGAQALYNLWQGANINANGRKYTDLDMAELAMYYDIVFHTFPSDVSKVINNHSQVSIPIIIIPDANLDEILPSWNSLRERLSQTDHFILYNGNPQDKWVRMSSVTGSVTIEYPSIEIAAQPTKIPFESDFGNTKFLKDLLPNTKIWSHRIAPNIIPIGRFATWDRKFLSHEAFEQTQTVLRSFAHD